MESALKDDITLLEEINDSIDREQTPQEKLLSDTFIKVAKRLNEDKEYLEEISKHIS
jgi:hypothetical protein